MQHCWLVEVAERCEVILAHQNVRISQVRQVFCLRVQLVLNVLRTTTRTGLNQETAHYSKYGTTRFVLLKDGGLVQNPGLKY